MVVVAHTKSGHTRGTIAIALPEKRDLLNLFEQHGTCTLLGLGISQVHPDDKFDRVVGREVSSQRVMYVKAYLDYVEIRGTKHIYHFKSDIDDTSSTQKRKKVVVFGLATTKESDSVQLVYATFGNRIGLQHD